MLATAHIVDIDALYAKAKEVIDTVAAGSQLKPLEPTAMEFSANALAITVTSPDGTDVFVIDALSQDTEAFDPIGALEAYVAALGEGLDITTQPVSELDDAESFATGSHFRAAVVTSEEPSGELRFSVTATTDEPAAAAGTPPPAEDPPPQEPAAPEAAAPDMSQLASRLPNLAAVDMDVTVELGRVRLPIKELLGLGSGSVVRLGTPIGDSFDILVNGKAAARGDLVVVGGKLAVRIRELLGIQA